MDSQNLPEAPKHAFTRMQLGNMVVPCMFCSVEFGLSECWRFPLNKDGFCDNCGKYPEKMAKGWYEIVSVSKAE